MLNHSNNKLFCFYIMFILYTDLSYSLSRYIHSVLSIYNYRQLFLHYLQCNMKIQNSKVGIWNVNNVAYKSIMYVGFFEIPPLFRQFKDLYYM